jgi:hypothetical protein
MGTQTGLQQQAGKQKQRGKADVQPGQPPQCSETHVGYPPFVK